MSNLLEPHKQEEILALGRLGWTLTRIGRATGVHRVTVGSTCAGRASDPRSGSAWRRSNDTAISGEVSRWAGLHAFRHSRVTMLRKNGAPADLQKQWIGHSSLKTTDRYSHTDQKLDYRRNAARRVGLDLIVGPNPSSWTQAASKGV